MEAVASASASSPLTVLFSISLDLTGWKNVVIGRDIAIIVDQLRKQKRPISICEHRNCKNCKNCNANCQCRWRSCNEVTKLKIIKRPAVRYFSIFLFEIQKIFIRKCSTFIYNPQALPGSLKFRTWCFFANPVFKVRSHPNAWHLKTVQWHGWTRSSTTSIFLSEIYQFFVGKYSIFIYNPQALLESAKIPTLSVSLTLYTKWGEIQERH